jgi:hypothetical protein
MCFVLFDSIFQLITPLFLLTKGVHFLIIFDQISHWPIIIKIHFSELNGSKKCVTSTTQPSSQIEQNFSQNGQGNQVGHFEKPWILIMLVKMNVSNYK